MHAVDCRADIRSNRSWDLSCDTCYSDLDSLSPVSRVISTEGSFPRSVLGGDHRLDRGTTRLAVGEGFSMPRDEASSTAPASASGGPRSSHQPPTKET